MEGSGSRSVQVYCGMAAAMDKLTTEAALLAEHSKRVREHNITLKKLNKSFNQVQTQLERVAATKPGFSQVHQ